MTKVKIRICADCLTADANGADDEGVSADWPGFDEWLDDYLLGPDYDQCRYECGACSTCNDLHDRWADGYFSWSPCEACGSGLGGQRWDFVVVKKQD